MEQCQISRPKDVKIGVTLLYIVLGIDVLGFLLNLPMLEKIQSAFGTSLEFEEVPLVGYVAGAFGAFFYLGFLWFLIYMIGNGYNWARITLLIWSIVGLLYNISCLPLTLTLHEYLSTPLWIYVLTFMSFAIRIIALVSLFKTSSSVWFKLVKEQRTLSAQQRILK